MLKGAICTVLVRTLAQILRITYTVSNVHNVMTNDHLPPNWRNKLITHATSPGVSSFEFVDSENRVSKHFVEDPFLLASSSTYP